MAIQKTSIHACVALLIPEIPEVESVVTGSISCPGSESPILVDVGTCNENHQRTAGLTQCFLLETQGLSTYIDILLEKTRNSAMCLMERLTACGGKLVLDYKVKTVQAHDCVCAAPSSPV